MRFVNMVLALFLACMLGWLMVIGKSIFLPILIAVISVFVLERGSQAIRRLPMLAAAPEWLIRLLFLLIFVIALLFLSGITVSTASQISQDLPLYEDNLTKLIDRVSTMLGMSTSIDMERVTTLLSENFSLSSIAGPALSSLATAGGTVFLVVIYATFIMAERGSFARKITAMFPKRQDEERAHSVMAQINSRISDYLAVKTLINIILGCLSFAILFAVGVEYAVFWAIVIGLLNYIPYVGSMIGVVLPVAFSVLQFGSLSWTVVLGVLLIGAQTWVGNMLEPKMIGRRLNMSPFVVLVSLSVFSALWGIAGAILAIPLTSMIAICLAAFEPSRPLAILLAEDIYE